MKKKMFSIIVVLSLVTMIFSTAAAPRSLEFDSFIHVNGKGYVALFNPHGEWSQDELWGFVSLPHNRQIDMDCKFRDDGKIMCTIADGISQYSSRYVKLTVYGYTFSVVVPNRDTYIAYHRGLSLESFAHIPGKGYTAIFKPQGTWRQTELWGFVTLPNESQISMDCKFNDDRNIVCTIADGISQFQDRYVTLVMYGYPFTVAVPKK